MTTRFGDVITSVIMLAPKSLQTGSLLVTKRRRRNTLLFLSNKLILVKFGISNSTLFATVIRQRLRIAG